MTLLTGLITAGARMQREVTLFIFGLILGLYILLTPFLGILVKAGTFVQVLYRFSPLQNIEAGYTALLSGARWAHDLIRTDLSDCRSLWG